MAGNKTFDTIIIGGSYAGLSAAMSLGRSLRSTLVIDSGSPCNRQTPHSHNFLTQDGASPQEISTLARRQVEQYSTVQLYDGFAISAKKTAAGFEVRTKGGTKDSGAGTEDPRPISNFSGKKLILATGIKDDLPEIKGLADCWGISVVHCPYCHGYEFRNIKTGIMANGDKAFHLATLVNNLTNDITMLTSGKADFKAEQLAKLDEHKIKIVDTKISEIVHQNGHLESVVFDGGTHMRFGAVYATVPFSQHTEIPAQLGCELTEHGHIKIDGHQKTNVDGVYACGDNSSPMRSVANAVYTGNLTGALVNKELTDERF